MLGPLMRYTAFCWHTEPFCSTSANKQAADSVAQRTSGATQLSSGRADLPSLNPLIKAPLNCQKLQKANKTAAAATETVSLSVQIPKKGKNKWRWTEHVHVWSFEFDCGWRVMRCQSKSLIRASKAMGRGEKKIKENTEEKTFGKCNGKKEKDVKTEVAKR